MLNNNAFHRVSLSESHPSLVYNCSLILLVWMSLWRTVTIFSMAGMINWLIENSSDYWLSVYNINYANYLYFLSQWQQIMYNMEVTEAFLITKWERFPALIDLIGLITSNDLSINLKLVIIDFRISANSHS